MGCGCKGGGTPTPTPTALEKVAAAKAASPNTPIRELKVPGVKWQVVNAGKIVGTFDTKAEAKEYFHANGGTSINSVNV